MSHDAFQSRVTQWMLACFGKDNSLDTDERNHRFFEEATELTQACGMTASEAHQLVDYVFGRPVGEKTQETGGVMVTLSALCSAQDINMQGAGEIELNRIWGKVEQIRAKQAGKPSHSPLPEHGKIHTIATLLEKVSCLELMLKWYATGQHLVGFDDGWEAVSGGPQNWLCGPGSAMVEDGGKARVVLDSSAGQGSADNTGTGLADRDGTALFSLLKEVSANFTRDDDLPDRLLGRIGLAVREYELGT